MKRKIIYIYFSFLILIFLVSCSNNNEQTLENDSETETSAPPVTETEEPIEEEAELPAIKQSDNIVYLNDIEAMELADYDPKKWIKIEQSTGLEDRIFYGNRTLLQSEAGSPGPGTYMYDLDQQAAIWQDTFNSISGSANIHLEDGLLYVVETEAVYAFNGETGAIEYK